MTVSALGGGQGHRMRALALAQRWNGRVTVLHGSNWDVPADGVVQRCVSPEVAQRCLLEGGETLIVDTFPGGVADEIATAVLEGFDRTVLVARALQVARYPGYEARAARYDERWLPYDEATCEWQARMVSCHPPGVYIGPLHRPLPMAPPASTKTGPPCPLVILGPSSLLPPGWKQRLPSDTRFIEHYIEKLPPTKRILAVGAGYHMVHELLPYRAAHFPLARRYDDQYRRAGIHDRALTSRHDLERFLEDDPCST